MAKQKTSSTQQTGPVQFGEDSVEVGEAVATLLRHLIGSAPGSLGGQLPGIMDELRTALSPLQALRPDYGELQPEQAKLLRQVQLANSRVDLSRASPTGQPEPKTETSVVQKGTRT